MATQRRNDLDPDNLWTIQDLPLLVREKLNIPENDNGIDNVYQNRQFGNYDVVQVKFKKERGNLSWSGDRISNFFGLADSEHINLKYVITN